MEIQWRIHSGFPDGVGVTPTYYLANCPRKLDEYKKGMGRGDGTPAPRKFTSDILGLLFTDEFPQMSLNRRSYLCHGIVVSCFK